MLLNYKECHIDDFNEALKLSGKKTFWEKQLMTQKKNWRTNMFEPRKRIALDGKTQWCVFDTDTMKWSTLIVFKKYKLKRDCQFAIDRYNRLYKDGR